MLRAKGKDNFVIFESKMSDIGSTSLAETCRVPKHRQIAFAKRNNFVDWSPGHDLMVADLGLHVDPLKLIIS